MDFGKPITYRGVELNDLELNNGRPMRGNYIDYAKFHSVRGVGYTEKRSGGDGNDSSDVTLAARVFLLRGGVSDRDIDDLYDRKQEIVSLFTPTAAYDDDPDILGYSPLFWYEPTGSGDFSDEDGDPDFIAGYKHLFAFVRPIAQPEIEFVKDRTSGGGKPDLGGTIPYAVALDAKDPRIYIFPPATEVLWEPGGDGSGFNASDNGTGNFANRGDYPTPLYVELTVGPQAKPGFWTLTGAGSVMRISVLASSNDIIYRYNGQTHILQTVENGVTATRMDLLNFLAETTHPQVMPGTSGYEWDSRWTGGGSTYDDIDVDEVSYMWFYPAQA